MKEFILNVFNDGNNFVTSFTVMAECAQPILNALRPHEVSFSGDPEDSDVINVRPLVGLKLTDDAVEKLLAAALLAAPEVSMVNEDISFGYGPISISTNPTSSNNGAAPYKLRFDKCSCSVEQDKDGITVTINAEDNKAMHAQLFGMANMIRQADEELMSRPWSPIEDGAKKQVDIQNEEIRFSGDAVSLVNKALAAGVAKEGLKEEEVAKYAINFYSENREDGVSLIMDMTKSNGDRMISEGFVSAMLSDFPQATIVPEKHGVYCQSTIGYIRKVRALLVDMGIEPISIVPVSTSAMLDTKVIYLV